MLLLKEKMQCELDIHLFKLVHSQPCLHIYKNALDSCFGARYSVRINFQRESENLDDRHLQWGDQKLLLCFFFHCQTFAKISGHKTLSLELKTSLCTGT